MTDAARNSKKYPRVLIISLNRINKSDQDSAAFLIRNIFGEWPRECLGQIFSSKDNGDEGFCGEYYNLGPNDRYLGMVFYSLKDLSGHVERVSSMQAVTRVTHNSNKLDKIKHYWANWFMSNQLYEPFFPLKISKELAKWISEFSPDVIYTTGSTIGFANISSEISERFKIPLCIHWSDDWPSAVVAKAPKIFKSSLYEKTIKRLIDLASIRWVFSPLMAEEYQHRYGHNFRVVMNGDFPARFLIPSKKQKTNDFVIALSGNFGINRWKSLADLCQVGMELSNEGIICRIIVYATELPLEAREGLSQYSNLEIKQSPPHSELPKRLCEADVLAIIESFDIKTASEIQFSISTKAHLFMMARRPILVYAPKNSGISQYAASTGFGAVINKQDIILLKETVKSLLLETGYSSNIVKKAWSIANKNHNINQIRKFVFDELNQIINTSREG